MSIFIVNLLEIIDIHQRKMERGALAAVFQRFFIEFVKRNMVIQPRQCIGGRQLADHRVLDHQILLRRQSSLQIACQLTPVNDDNPRDQCADQQEERDRNQIEIRQIILEPVIPAIQNEEGRRLQAGGEQGEIQPKKIADAIIGSSINAPIIRMSIFR